jgi:hypothetical protein
LLLLLGVNPQCLLGLQARVANPKSLQAPHYNVTFYHDAPSKVMLLMSQAPNIHRKYMYDGAVLELQLYLPLLGVFYERNHKPQPSYGVKGIKIA